jgi:hypothetical protein
MAALGGFMFVMFRRDIKLGRDHEPAGDVPDNKADKG